MPQLLSGSVLVCAMLSLAAGSALQARDFADSQLMHIDYPGWFKDSFLDLQEDIQEARGESKLGLMVLFTTEGCSYCDMFIRRSLGDQHLASLVQTHFDAVGLEIFNDAEMLAPRGNPLRVKEFAKREGAGFAPTLLFYGEDGSRTTPAGWYADLGFSRLPALLFFEERGKQVLSTDALVLRQRMLNSLMYTLERAYEKDWTYQRFARSQAIERRQQ